MGSITAGGHTFRELRVDGGRLRSELARMSQKNRATRFFLRKGCVITEISVDDPEPTGSDVADESYVLIVDEQA
jgi:hypothetical protein